MYQSVISNNKDIEILIKISDRIKEIISNIDKEYINNILVSHYRTLHLVDYNGKWMTENLNKISHILIPNNVSHDVLGIFIDNITMLCTKNNYLMSFFKEWYNKKNSNIVGEFATEDKKAIIDIIIYAYMLEIICKECLKDYLLLEELYHCFSVNRDKFKASIKLPLTYKFRLMWAEDCIRKYLKNMKMGKNKNSVCNIAVSKSILAITFSDLIHGQISNMKAGLLLLINWIKFKYINEEIPRKSGSNRSDLAKAWINLHQLWNICFAIRFKNFSYNITSFLIPEVADYYSNPFSYINNLNISVYVTLNFTGFMYTNMDTSKVSTINWKNKDLREIITFATKRSYKAYKEKVRSTKL